MSQRLKKEQVVEKVEKEEPQEEPEESESESVLKAFQYFDKEGKGLITAQELKVILTRLGNPLTEEETAEIFNESNLEDDGKIKYKDFIESAGDTVFTARQERKNLISLEESPQWLFWSGDLIIVNNEDSKVTTE